METGNQEPGENDAQGDVAGRPCKWDRHMSDAVKIARKGVAGKAEDVESGDDPQITDSLREDSRIGSVGDENGQGRGQDSHEQAHADPHSCQKTQTDPEAFFDAFFVAGAETLCDQDGGGGTAAVPEGIGETFDPGRGSEGCDQGCTARVYGTLYHHFSQIEGTLVKTCYKRQFQRFVQERGIHPAVFALQAQKRSTPV